jgi:hypothetical protein
MVHRDGVTPYVVYYYVLERLGYGFDGLREKVMGDGRIPVAHVPSLAQAEAITADLLVNGLYACIEVVK